VQAAIHQTMATFPAFAMKIDQSFRDGMSTVTTLKSLMFKVWRLALLSPSLLFLFFLCVSERLPVSA
jgi:hypothetical protein